jgi:hypothetical protein
MSGLAKDCDLGIEVDLHNISDERLCTFREYWIALCIGDESLRGQEKVFDRLRRPAIEHLRRWRERRCEIERYKPE